MKRLSLLLAFSALLACAIPPETIDERAPSQERPEATYRDALRALMARESALEKEAETEEKAETENHPAVADWLLQRQAVCSQTSDVIDAQLGRHQESFTSAERNAEPDKARSQLQALTLASCAPAQTPGLFGEFLRHVHNSADWPADYQALFELMSSQLNAYVILERRYKELEAQHQKTIEGLGNIEQFLDPLAEPDQ